MRIARRSGSGFLAETDSYEMGVPAVLSAGCTVATPAGRIGNVELCLRAPVSRIAIESGSVRGVVVR